MSFNFGSIERVKVAVSQIPENKNLFIKDTLNDLLDLLLKNINKKAPRDTGDYAKSWKKGTVSGNKGTVETPMGELFDILEFQGRRPGRIDGNPLLAFVWKGEDVFFRFVEHPGFDEMPHVRPAIRETMKEANRIITKNLKKHMTIFR